MIPAGSIVSLSITSTTTVGQSADGIIQAVSSMLANDGRLTVKQVKSPTSAFDLFFGAATTINPYQPFQVNMDVQTNTDFSGTDDPLSIVEGMFYQVTGSYPTTGSTVSVQTPGAEPIATGQPSAASTGPGGASGVGSSISDAISKFFSDLTGTAKSLLIGLAAIIVLALVLIAYGPNIGRAASRI